MRSKKMLAILVVGLMVSLALVGKAAPMGTAWTYQGRLIDTNEPAGGLYDFEFRLFDDPCAGTQQGSTIDVNELNVIDGYFTAEMDFGSDVFSGDDRWLEIGVRPGDMNDPNDFVTLNPRQKVTATPYAVSSSQVTGRVRTPGIYETMLYGNNWTAKDSNRDWRAVAMSADGTKQTAVAFSDYIYISTDSGNTWTAKDSGRGWLSVAMSADGTKQTAVVYGTLTGGYIYVSMDSGNTWTQKGLWKYWYSVAMSADGTIQTAVARDGRIYVSTDSGNTWTPKGFPENWKSVAMSEDGTKQTAVDNGGYIYVSTDTGNTWTAKESNRNWVSVAMSADGAKQTAAAQGGQIYVSTNSGNTWTAKESNRNWVSVAMSADGTKQTAAVWGGQIYVSTDSGNTWTAKESDRQWFSVAMSEDGTKQTVVAQDGQIYISSSTSVGIGTSSPTSKLDVAGNINLSGALQVNNSRPFWFKKYTFTANQNIDQDLEVSYTDYAAAIVGFNLGYYDVSENGQKDHLRVYLEKNISTGKWHLHAYDSYDTYIPDWTV